MSSRGNLRSAKADNLVVPKAAVGRLSLYLRQLECEQKDGTATVSSRRLGESLGFSDAQVRKDLGYFGQFGHAGVGYRVAELIETIRGILGTDREWPVALVGIGNLGRALLGYRGFRRQGFRIRAVFDLDPKKVGQSIEGIRVESPESIVARVTDLDIAFGIIAVPADAAQHVAERLVAGGVRGILSFAPVSLALPNDVSLVQVDLAIQLESLCFRVRGGRRAGES